MALHGQEEHTFVILCMVFQEIHFTSTYWRFALFYMENRLVSHPWYVLKPPKLLQGWRMHQLLLNLWLWAKQLLTMVRGTFQSLIQPAQGIHSSSGHPERVPGVRTELLIIRCIQLNWLPSSDWMLTLIQQSMFYRHNCINENRNALISWGCLFTSSGLSLRNNWKSITNAYFLVVCLHLIQSWNLDTGQRDFFHGYWS